MFMIRTRYACVLSLLFGTFALGARGAVMPENGEQSVADSTEVQDGQPQHGNTVDPFTYSVQNRYLPMGQVYHTDSTKWYSHLDFHLFSGVTLHGTPRPSGDKSITRMDYGLPFGFSFGYNWHRLHGVHLMYLNHTYGHNNRVPGTLHSNELGVGYSFNLTNYFKGYNPKKRMTVAATATVLGTMTKDDEKREMGVRGEMGLLFRYRFWRQFYFSLEPFFGIASDDYDHFYTPHRYDWVAGIRAGAGFDGTVIDDFSEHIRRNKTDLYKPKAWWQNIYFGSSAGYFFSNADTRNDVTKKRIDTHVFMGYRFSPVQSLRMQATYFKNPEYLERKHHVMGELDYVINFTNMWRGYHPDRALRVSGYVGVGARYLEHQGADTRHVGLGTYSGNAIRLDRTGSDKIAPYGTVGFDFHYYVTPQISFFAEPYAAYALSFGKGGKNTIFGGARAGFQIDLIDTYIYMPHYALSDEEMTIAQRWRARPLSHFYFGSGVGLKGVHIRHQHNYKTMPFNIFLGYRFTPVQSVRIQAIYTHTKEDILYRKHMSGEIDYMVNFTNLLYGYKPTRKFDVSGFVGGGVRNVEEPGTNGKMGIFFSSGAHVRYRIYKGVNAYVEPYANLVHEKSQRYYIFDYGVTGGVNVTLDDAYLYGDLAHGIPSKDWEKRWWRHLFVGGSGGIMGVHTHAYGNEITTPMHMFAGYRFSPNQAIRAKGSYIRTFENMDRTKHMQGEIDYMINLTNMFVPHRTRRLFNVMAFWGVGAKYLDNLNNREGKFSPMATMGVDVAMRIKRSLSVMAEPYLQVEKGKNQGYYTINYGANLGLALNLEEVYAYSPKWGKPSPSWSEKPKYRLFFGGMAGFQRTEFVRDHNAMPISLFTGYRFNPNHALRGKVSLVRSKFQSKTNQHFTAGVDYMFNGTNMICGYDPNRFINLIGFIGFGVRDLTPSRKLSQDMKLGFMGNAGMDFAMRLTRNVNFFVEPYVGAQHAPSKSSFIDFFIGANAGVVVNLYDIDQPWPGTNLRTNHNVFFEAGYGWMFPLGTGASTKGSGLSVDVRAGVWIDPIFGARLSLIGQDYGYSKHWHSAARKATEPNTGYANALTAKFRFEGMLNPMGISRSYREDAHRKKFEVNLAAGIELGMQGKKYAIGKDQDYYPMYGLTAAAQFLYKFHYNTAIFVEPRYEFMTSFYQHSNDNRYGGHRRDNVVTVNAGVRFMRGTRDEHDDERRLNFEQTMFFGLSGGGYKAIATYKVINGGRMGYFGNFNFGFLITPLHGLKMSIQPSWYHARIDELGDEKKFTIMDYRWLYMLNFSNKYQRLARRKIDVYMEVGPVLSSIIRHSPGITLAQSRYNGASNKRSFGISGGFLICYNITKKWAITTEPISNFMIKKGFMPGYAVKPKMGRARVDLSLGTQFKF